MGSALIILFKTAEDWHYQHVGIKPWGLPSLQHPQHINSKATCRSVPFVRYAETSQEEYSRGAWKEQRWKGRQKGDTHSPKPAAGHGAVWLAGDHQPLASIKSPTALLMKIEKAILKFTQSQKEPQIAKTVLKKSQAWIKLDLVTKPLSLFLGYKIHDKATAI